MLSKSESKAEEGRDLGVLQGDLTPTPGQYLSLAALTYPTVAPAPSAIAFYANEHPFALRHRRSRSVLVPLLVKQKEGTERETRLGTADGLSHIGVRAGGDTGPQSAVPTGRPPALAEPSTSSATRQMAGLSYEDSRR